MQLTLAIHPIRSMQFGDATELVDRNLVVDEEGLRQHLLEDSRLASVGLEIVSPGEDCRIGIIFDILEPRAKSSNWDSPPEIASNLLTSNSLTSNFPGILGPMAMAGRGTTHVLKGAAVTVLDEAAPLTRGKIVDMSGPAAAESPYSPLHHLVVVPHTVPGLERRVALNALRLASVKAAVFLAQASVDLAPDETQVLETAGPSRQEGDKNAPRFAYIGQVHSRQRVAEVGEQIFYGDNTAGMVPTPLHPNEWLDGAITTGFQGMGVETYFYQNHPIITELYRWHEEGRINLVGTIATMAASDNQQRERNCMMAAELAKWNLGADGVVLTKYGGGAPHADMALTALLCEQLGMRTAVQVSDMSWDRRAESALLFNYPEVDAIVYVGGQDTKWSVSGAQRVVAGNAETLEALKVPQDLGSHVVCGLISQQGASRLRSFVY